jgi:O-antigen/teichoic acid export membrane protein
MFGYLVTFLAAYLSLIFAAILYAQAITRARYFTSWIAFIVASLFFLVALLLGPVHYLLLVFVALLAFLVLAILILVWLYYLVCRIRKNGSLLPAMTKERKKKKHRHSHSRERRRHRKECL